MINQALFTSKKKDWNTPRDIYAALDDEFHFMLDAAASDINHKAPKWYTVEDDALKQSWKIGGGGICQSALRY